MVQTARLRTSACLIKWLHWTHLIEIAYLHSVYSERTGPPLAHHVLKDFLYVWPSLKELLLLLLLYLTVFVIE